MHSQLSKLRTPLLLAAAADEPTCTTTPEPTPTRHTLHTRRVAAADGAAADDGESESARTSPVAILAGASRAAAAAAEGIGQFVGGQFVGISPSNRDASTAPVTACGSLHKRKTAEEEKEMGGGGGRQSAYAPPPPSSLHAVDPLVRHLTSSDFSEVSTLELAEGVKPLPWLAWPGLASLPSHAASLCHHGLPST